MCESQPYPSVDQEMLMERGLGFRKGPGVHQRGRSPRRSCSCRPRSPAASRPRRWPSTLCPGSLTPHIRACSPTPTQPAAVVRKSHVDLFYMVVSARDTLQRRGLVIGLPRHIQEALFAVSRRILPHLQMVSRHSRQSILCSLLIRALLPAQTAGTPRRRQKQ